MVDIWQKMVKKPLTKLQSKYVS